MKLELHTHDSRGVSELSWLSSRFSFSFAEYYNEARMNFGALRVLNDDTIAAGSGFGMHSHRDMEIISIPLCGELTHKDSLGNELTIGPDDVQTMSAGSGVIHSEINHSHDVEGQFLQIWIATRKKGITPSHRHGTFPASEQLNTFVTLVQPDTAMGNGLAIHQDAYIARGRFTRDVKGTYTVKEPGNGVFVFLISGSMTIEGQKLSARDAVAITEAVHITVSTHGDEPADVLFIEVPMS